jgi:cell division septation protein DedD
VSLGDFGQELLFDLSEGGLSVYGRHSHFGRRGFPVSFRLPGDENPITALGEVAWAARNRTGVRFVDFPAAARSRLRNWMATKLSPVSAYPANYKAGWPKRVFRFMSAPHPDTSHANYFGKTALTIPVFVAILLIGLALNHSRAKSTQTPQAHMSEIAGQVLAAQPSESAPNRSLQASQTGSSSAPSTPSLTHLRHGFVLQVGALKRERYADDLSNSLNQKGYPAAVSRTAADGLYRVVVGPYPDISTAVRVRTKLKAQNIDGFVKPWDAE